MPPQRSRPLPEIRTQEVQAAALRVISRKGIAGATMQEIADEAGIAKGTLYLYFKDRDDLVERTADHAFSKLTERLDGTLPGIPTFREKLTALVRTEIAFFDEHREFFRIYVAYKQPPAELYQNARRRRACHPRYANHLLRLEKVLREAMVSGEVRHCDPARLALLVSESAVALMLRRLAEDRPPEAEVDVRWLVDFLLHGIEEKGS
ncbi:MAG TPA: TetR/AcrR family transcriptional regulator [Vicinamibacteria bacterium]|nr:TetR/AcrR family transcriptional regulator [Vicinamibacteria bacterium]